MQQKMLWKRIFKTTVFPVQRDAFNASLQDAFSRLLGTDTVTKHAFPNPLIVITTIKHNGTAVRDNPATTTNAVAGPLIVITTTKHNITAVRDNSVTTTDASAAPLIVSATTKHDSAAVTNVSAMARNPPQFRRLLPQRLGFSPRTCLLIARQPEMSSQFR